MRLLGQASSERNRHVDDLAYNEAFFFGSCSFFVFRNTNLVIILHANGHDWKGLFYRATIRNPQIAN